jgi:hypothetical protein
MSSRLLFDKRGGTKEVKLIFYTMMAEVIHFQRVAILKTA